MKKVIFILNEIPFPRNKSGVTLFDYELLKRQPNDFMIDVYVLNDDNEQVVNEFKKEFPNIGSVFLKQIKVSKSKWVLNVLFCSFFSRSILRNEAHVFFNDYDCAYISPMLARVNINKIKIPIFMNAIDSFSKYNYREYNQKKSVYSYFKYLIYSRYERFLIKKVSLFSMVSNEDVSFVSQRNDEYKDKIINVSIGVDANYFSPKTAVLKTSTWNIIFVGNYNYFPNKDAALYLAENIFPLVKEKIFNARLYIVGANPPEFPLNKDIISTGYVEDLRYYYNNSHVFVCPLRFGAGLKNKILEALSCGLPTISSNVGVEGISGLINGVNYLEATSTEDFAQKIIDIFGDSELTSSLSLGSRESVIGNFSWESSSIAIFEHLKGIV